jgi:glutaredoxin
MSFTKLPYDPCAYKTSLEESMKTGVYMLNTPKVDCGENCFIQSPYIRLDKKNVGMCKNREIVDVHSELLGLNRVLTECPLKKEFDPKYCENNILAECENTFLSPEDTKLSNPSCTLRGTGWNRWESLRTNPQDKAITPFLTDIQNKTIIKDNHRPCIPNVNAMNNVLPNDNNTCYTDKDAEHLYKESKSIPFIHWRSCSDIRKL